MKVWNVETNKLLDVLACPPTKPIADFGIAYQRRYMLLTCIQNNVLSVYYNSLDNVNFDEDVDTIPTQSNSSDVPRVEHSAQPRVNEGG